MSLRAAGKLLRYTFLSIWAAVIIVAVAFYLSDPHGFNAPEIARFIHSFRFEIWLVYLGMSAFRGFTLLPSTPLVLAGTLLYPDEPWLVLAISMAGIVISSTLIYFGSEALGFSDYFESKKPEAIHKIRQRLEHPFGLAFVAVWAFFPLVPTDAICYVAGTIRMNFPKFISAIFIGELALCSIYVFSGGFLIDTLV
jgi:uncharacterized membrane protein YdjX (TVP38/TMEM64 family)